MKEQDERMIPNKIYFYIPASIIFAFVLLISCFIAFGFEYNERFKPGYIAPDLNDQLLGASIFSIYLLIEFGLFLLFNYKNSPTRKLIISKSIIDTIITITIGTLLSSPILMINYT
ncbi:hypothetical protein [Cohnella luojiensis]|uniref:Uncharacterized protein n=1 Tax=Cohnella luojiensis TaxID=652876 RepID=A0A4Y8LMR7_9BACL|nr:hypothetical protein [Cohnella luojiensis]TFE19339.1 hypothetical protein E2980_23535 [Cohnella luojiensis]